MLEGERRAPGGRNPIRTCTDSPSTLFPEKKGKGYSRPVSGLPTPSQPFQTTPITSNAVTPNWSDIL
jgi:hypothetical protein